MGHFVVLGQFVARKVPVKQCFFMSASVGHFVAGEKIGHFVAGTICITGRKWDILSSGTIDRPENVVGTICRWDKMSPNQIFTQMIAQIFGRKNKSANICKKNLHKQTKKAINPTSRELEKKVVSAASAHF